MFVLLALAAAVEALKVSGPTVKILQLTDLHYGEEDLNDLRNDILVSNLLDWEQPDLVVVTGDLVSGYRWQGQPQWYEGFHSRLVNHIESRNISWAFVLGNHDLESELTGKDIVDLDKRHSLSLMKQAAQQLPHDSNYYVTLHHETEAPLVLWMLDTGNRDHSGLQGYDHLHQAQLKWQRDTHKVMQDVIGKSVPGIAFMHIPPPEYIDLWNSGKASGNRFEDVSCWATGRGGLAAMSGLIAVGVGHDHFNDYEGDFDGIHLYYGRKTGFGGSGPDPFFDRGARVYSYNFETGALDSWIRTEAGRFHRATREKGLGSQSAPCTANIRSPLWNVSSFLQILGVLFLASCVALSTKCFSFVRFLVSKEQRFIQ